MAEPAALRRVFVDEVVYFLAPRSNSQLVHAAITRKISQDRQRKSPPNMEDKENTAPVLLGGDMSSMRALHSPQKGGRRGRSKSIGPGALDDMNDTEKAKREAKNRRKSAFVPAAKSILSKNEDAEKAARRKTMVNRRVSFAPEATLHTWDIIESARDHTTSTDSTDSTRRGSAMASMSSSSPAASSDRESQEPESPNQSRSEIANRSKKYRRSSGIPPMNFNNPDEIYSSGVDGSSDASGSDEEAEVSEDETGTAMSLDVDDATMQSSKSDSSTSSNARLEAALRQAAQTAGTRGIEYDEYGDMSMEIAAEEITNAFQPWVQHNNGQNPGLSLLDQENVNPFSTDFVSQMAPSGPETIVEETEDDMSMDVTRAVGGILKGQSADLESSPGSDGAMDLTQAVGRITGQKRRRSTADTGSPAISTTVRGQGKRRRSSAARSSMGDEMDLTIAVGGIQKNVSPSRPQRHQGTRRRSSAASSVADEATMEFTRAVGRITTIANTGTDGSLDSDQNEEQTMELTTALGGINPGDNGVPAAEARPVTPQISQSPLRSAVNTTPKDQARFKDAPDLGAKQLLTPIFQKQARLSAEKSVRSATSPRRVEQVFSPLAPRSPNVVAPAAVEEATAKEVENAIVYPKLPSPDKAATPSTTPTTPRAAYTTPDRTVQQELDVQSRTGLSSPLSAKRNPGLPERPARSVEKQTRPEDTRTLADSIKLLSTPRKEVLKSVTPRKQVQPAQPISPIRSTTPKARPTPRFGSSTKKALSPSKHLAEDLARIETSGRDEQAIGLSDFLNQAGIKFMDLTTTKRRMTTAPTPSKARKAGALSNDTAMEEVNLESSIVAAACTLPEMELYQHACHELKRYTKEGKQMVADLEAETAKDTPPLMLAYMNAAPVRKAELDTHMRDMKTNARLRSKEMWYAWRSQLLDELMGGLQTIGENLIKDDEIIGRSETIIEEVLPGLIQQHASLEAQFSTLEKEVVSVSEDEKVELEATRETLSNVNASLTEKRRRVQELRQQVKEQDDLIAHLGETKVESIAATQEAIRVRESCRGVSISEITSLKGELPLCMNGQEGELVLTIN